MRNFAIIEKLDLEFGSGFNVITGETGAGKSVIMGALNLVLGGRGGVEVVRQGAEKASVDALFETDEAPIIQQLAEEMGLDISDGLILSREVTASGKSVCRICGRPVTVAQLKQVGDELVDLHGQHEHQSLLSQSRHIQLLDSWGGAEITQLRKQVSDVYKRVRDLQHERDSLQTDARERARMIDLYGYQVKEIREAGFQPGDEETLESEYRRVANGQKLLQSVQGVLDALEDEKAGIMLSLAASEKLLGDAAEVDPNLQPQLDVIKNTSYELMEVTRDLSRYVDSIEFSPEQQTEMEERIELLRSLRRKYGDTLEDVLAYEQEISKKLDDLSHSEERSDEIVSMLSKAEAELVQLCNKLTLLRQTAAAAFQNSTLTELKDLALEKARFEVQIEDAAISGMGKDRVEFLIAANPGEVVHPLVKVASGGEISRVMLAIKSALSRQEALPTMVFDEIDVGVGGRTAFKIAQKMENLASNVQILCITHLAQIASRAKHHFLIEKRVEGSRTLVDVVRLTEDERVLEVARMIGGLEPTEAVLMHASEMLATKSPVETGLPA